MADDLTKVSSFDVYERMISLNFPEETANFFQEAMKDGLACYILSERVPIIESQNVNHIMALFKLVLSFVCPNFQPFSSSPNRTIMCEPWPMSNVIENTSSAEKFKKNETEKKAEQETPKMPEPCNKVNPRKPPHPLKLTLKDITNVRLSSSATTINTSPDETSLAEASLKLLPQLGSFKGEFHDQEQLAIAQLLPRFEPSDIKVLVCDRMVTLPRFSPDVEDSLNLESECFQVLPTACKELAKFFLNSNLDIRTSNDYHAIGQGLLPRYETLDLVIRRCIQNNWLNPHKNPPKNPLAYFVKQMQAALFKERIQMKKNAQKTAQRTTTLLD